jgi:hypothetical protein
VAPYIWRVCESVVHSSPLINLCGEFFFPLRVLCVALILRKSVFICGSFFPRKNLRSRMVYVRYKSKPDKDQHATVPEAYYNLVTCYEA